MFVKHSHRRGTQGSINSFSKCWRNEIPWSVGATVQMKGEMPDIIPVFTICGPALEKRKKWAHTSGTYVFPDIQVATYCILISALEPLLGATVGGNKSISFCFFIQPKWCPWYPLNLQSYSVFHVEDPQPPPILPSYPSLNTFFPTCSFFPVPLQVIKISLLWSSFHH